jgi:MFS family permease
VPSPRYYYGWNILTSCFIVQALAIGVVIYGFGTLMLPLANEFGMSRAQMQLCYSSMLLLSGLLSPIGALVMERFSIRWLIALGGVLFGVGYGIISASTSYAAVLGAYVGVLSFAEVMLGNMSTGALLAHWFSRRRGLALGINAVGLSFGGLIFPPLAAMLITQHGWRTTFAVFAVGATLSIVALALFVIRDRPNEGQMLDQPTRVAGVATESHHAKESRRWSYSELARSSRLWIFTIVLGGAQCAHSGVFLNLVPFGTDQNLSLPQAALLVSVVSVVAVIAKVGFGIVADRVDYRLVLACVVASNILGTALLIASDGGYLIMMAAAVVLGLGLGGMMPVWGVMVAREFGAASFGRVTGVMRVVTVPLAMSGPVFAGWMFDRMQDYNLAFYVLIGLQVVLVLLLLLPGMKQGRAPIQVEA